MTLSPSEDKGWSLSSPPGRTLAKLGVAWMVINWCIHQSQRRHRCRKSGTAPLICWQWWKKNSPEGNTSQAQAEAQVNQSRKEAKRQEKPKVTNFAGIVPPTRLFQQNMFMFGDWCQDTLPTEHQAPLAGNSPAVFLSASSRNVWDSCGHILRAASGNEQLW